MNYKFIPLQGKPLSFRSALKAYNHLMHTNYEIKVINQHSLLFLEKKEKTPLLKEYLQC
tara:strand:+ start:249 stop:425 length:177 start_codon:yes stop_codon:yes gene_type:complete